MTLSRLVRCANRVDFACDTYKYTSINDITREHHGLVQGEVNVSGPELRTSKYFTQDLTSELFKASQLRLQAEGLCQNEHGNAM